jgi:RNA polymerase sigma-70 factor (sigma-E family)
MSSRRASEADEDFERFVQASWRRLTWAAYLLCGDQHLAEDMAQGALARTYSAWSRVRSEDAFAYTRSALVNLNIDRLRKIRVRDAKNRLLSQDDARTDTDIVVERDELVRMLLDLTDQERKVVVLRHYYDLSEAAVAAELKVPKGTVKSTLSRALSKLRVQARDHELTTGRA